MWLMLITGALQAQEGERLTIPSSPAFTILGFEPSAVMKPTSTKELTTNILSAFGPDGRLVPNLGMEVTPYWLGVHPGLTRDSFLRPSVAQAFRQSFSLSAATVYDSVSNANKLGFGFRFNLRNGKPTQEFLELDSLLQKKYSLTSIIAVARSMAGTAFTTPDGANTFIESRAAATTDAADIALLQELEQQLLQTNQYDSTTSGLRKYLEDLTNEYQDKLAPQAAQLSELTYDRTGFFLEFAGGSGFNTRGSKPLSRLGLWGNASWYVSPDDLFSFTARYLYNRSGGPIDSLQHNIDLGVSFLKKTRLFNFSLEALYRYYNAEIPQLTGGTNPVILKEKKSTYRFAFQSAVNISPTLSITVSLGKDFDSPFLRGNGMFSILGFSYNIFSLKPKQLVQESLTQ